jgi:hypothetical protein
MSSGSRDDEIAASMQGEERDSPTMMRPAARGSARLWARGVIMRLIVSLLRAAAPGCLELSVCPTFSGQNRTLPVALALTRRQAALIALGYRLSALKADCR